MILWCETVCKIRLYWFFRLKKAVFFFFCKRTRLRSKKRGKECAVLNRTQSM